MYGGAITSVLLNVPGESSSVPTAIEGYPMARQGRAGPAIGMSAIALCGWHGGCYPDDAFPPLAGCSQTGPPEYFLMILDVHGNGSFWKVDHQGMIRRLG
jgi:putative tricarboxylic transport membrane protein